MPDALIQPWRIIYYISTAGNSPVKEFLDDNLKAKVKALRIFSNIEEYGLSSVIPHIKKLTGTPLWEIRILGEDSVRILYVTWEGKQILLLHAFVKKTDKTPLKEINVALNRLNEVLTK
ncbi:MAG: type II toxin-antitoxin system RelE/ParE family toxin [Nanoarchaeota archaeon]